MAPKQRRKSHTRTDAKRRRLTGQSELLAEIVGFAMNERLEQFSRAPLLRLLNAHVGDAIVFGDAIAELGAWTPSQVEAMRLEIARLIVGLLNLVERDGEGLMPEYEIKGLSLRFAFALDGDRVLVALDGTARDVILHQFMALLRAVGVGRLKRCPEGKCGHRPFVKIGVRAYCSTRCQNRAWMRAGRQRSYPATVRRRNGKTTRSR